VVPQFVPELSGPRHSGWGLVRHVARTVRQAVGIPTRRLTKAAQGLAKFCQHDGAIAIRCGGWRSGRYDGGSRPARAASGVDGQALDTPPQTYPRLKQKKRVRRRRGGLLLEAKVGKTPPDLVEMLGRARVAPLPHQVTAYRWAVRAGPPAPSWSLSLERRP
jgi:hypothetical protein